MTEFNSLNCDLRSSKWAGLFSYTTTKCILIDQYNMLSIHFWSVISKHMWRMISTLHAVHVNSSGHRKVYSKKSLRSATRSVAYAASFITDQTADSEFQYTNSRHLEVVTSITFSSNKQHLLPFYRGAIFLSHITHFANDLAAFKSSMNFVRNYY